MVLTPLHQLSSPDGKLESNKLPTQGLPDDDEILTQFLSHSLVGGNILPIKKTFLCLALKYQSNNRT